MLRTLAVLSFVTVSLTACGGQDSPQEETDTSVLPTSVEELTGELKEAYEKCLYDRQAEAVAIEVIEASCFKQVTGEDDPLGIRELTPPTPE